MILALLPLSPLKNTGHIKLGEIFTDHMVLQRDTNAPIWGTADPGEKISVSIAGHTASGIVDTNGNWSLNLRNLPAGGPYTLVVRERSVITLHDILIGDVWLTSGQSNMGYPMHSDPENTAAAKTANDSQLRYVAFPGDGSKTSQLTWETASPQTTPYWSAVAYYFGKELRTKANIPIGIVESAVGSTSGESWVSLSTLKEHLDILASAQSQMHLAQTMKLPVKNSTPGYMFNNMIEPIVNYGITGAVWYQGENNTWPQGHEKQYGELLSLLIKDWRTRWGWSFPFYIVQLHGYKGSSISTDPNAMSSIAEIREKQLQVSQTTPNSALVITDELGDTVGDVHPTDKLDVGHRLALIALAKRYREPVAYSGPIESGFSISEGNMIIRFTHIEGGLIAKGGTLARFSIAGINKNFVWADAKIAGNTIIVSSSQVPKPVAVRYAWEDNPLNANLYNGAGLPASPFRIGQ